jgi:hypothetical protein
VRDRVAPLLPLATRVFHVGFIPLVIFLGMRTEPRPALTDLLQPSARAAPRHAFFLAPCTRANRPHARNLPAQCESAARAGRPHAWRCFEEASWPGCGAAPPFRREREREGEGGGSRGRGPAQGRTTCRRAPVRRLLAARLRAESRH